MKKIITFIFTFVLSIMILLCLVINVCSSTVLNQEYVLSKLEENNYYEKTYNMVKDNFENYIQQSGLDDDVLENIVTQEEIKKDTIQILDNIYVGISGDDISTKNIKERLQQNIDKSLENRKLSSESKEAIDSFITKIGNEYDNTILNTKYEDSLNIIYKKVVDLKGILLKVVTVSIGFSIIVIIITNFKKIYKTVSAISVSLLSSGMFLVFVKVYIDKKVKLQSILILNNNISEVFRNVLVEIFDKFLIYGIILSVLGLVLLIVSNLIHNIRKYDLNEEL